MGILAERLEFMIRLKNWKHHSKGWVGLIWGAVSPALLKSIPQGAATQCYVACHPAVAAVTGTYFSNCNVARPTAPGRDAALAARLWAESERIVARLA